MGAILGADPDETVLILKGILHEPDRKSFLGQQLVNLKMVRERDRIKDLYLGLGYPWKDLPQEKYHEECSGLVHFLE
jgi:hypothetical protein